MFESAESKIEALLQSAVDDGMEKGKIWGLWLVTDLNASLDNLMTAVGLLRKSLLYTVWTVPLFPG